MAKRSAADDVQEYLPGTAPEKIESVHNAAVAMLDACRKAKSAKAKELAAREEVRLAMEEEAIEVYEYGGIFVTIENKKTPKVTQVKKQKKTEEEEE